MNDMYCVLISFWNLTFLHSWLWWSDNINRTFDCQFHNPIFTRFQLTQVRWGQGWWKQLLLQVIRLQGFFPPQWHWDWTSVSESQYASSHCQEDDWLDMNIFKLESFNSDNVPNKSFLYRELNSLISQRLPEQRPFKRFYCAPFSGSAQRV